MGTMELSDPDYDVTGDGDPSPNGEYYYAGEYGGEPYYTRADEAYSIWWDTISSKWFITVAPGNGVAGNWSRLGSIAGIYGPVAPYTGNPVVAIH